MIRSLPNTTTTPNAALCQTHMRRLADFHSLLLHRASVTQGSERKMLLAQANKVHHDIEDCCAGTLTNLEKPNHKDH